MNAERALNDYEQSLISNVRDFGCQVTSVIDPVGEQVSYSYSIGFTETVGQPETIVFGLPSNVMNFMINETLHQCREGLQLDDWAEIDGLLEGHRCIARTIPAQRVTREHFNSALWYQRRTTGKTTIEAVQIVWPGALDGLFPWDDGCAEEVRELQPPSLP